jgi:hypothetical protein
MGADENKGSGTPLARKLGVRPGMALAWLDAPEGFEATLGPLPGGVERAGGLDGHLDLVVCFVTEREVLADGSGR